MEIDRYGNVVRHHAANVIQNGLERNHDAQALRSGWRVDGTNYWDSGTRAARSNNVVTRAQGYIPYQSIYEPDGRHAYNPAARQYPQVNYDERQAGLIAETPTDRANWYNQMRPGNLPLGAQLPFYVDGVGHAIGDPTMLHYPSWYGRELNQPVRMIDMNQQGMQGPGGGYGGFGGGYGNR